MPPDGERTSRKTSSPSSSAFSYSLITNKAAKPVDKTVVPKHSRQSMYTMTPDDDRISPKSLSSIKTTARYTLGTANSAKPDNKTVLPKQSLQQQQRQKQQQQQLQQIRAIRRKRTVAFAVNHERVSQPHAASVVSAEAAPECDNSSSAQLKSTRDTVSSEKILKNRASDLGNSTVNRDLVRSRASTVIRDSSCTFQQNASGFGEDYHVKDSTSTNHLRQKEKQMLSGSTNHQRSYFNDETPNLSKDSRVINCESNHDTADKRQKQNSKRSMQLVVDVRCAEAAAAAMSKNITLTTSGSCDLCLSSPVPVTPTYLSPCVHGMNDLTANASTKRGRVGRPSKKLGSCLNQEEEDSSSVYCPSSSQSSAKLSRKPKVKRVRYDMECVASVEINQDLWRDVTIRFRKHSQSNNPSLPTQSIWNDNINDNHTPRVDCKEQSPSGSPGVMTIFPNNENFINNFAQSPSNLLLQGSVLWMSSSRKEWEDCVNEMKAVCTSAAFRRWSKGIINGYESNISTISLNNNSQTVTASNALSYSPHSSTTMTSFQPPLSQAFIKDRVQIDDPLTGYQIRHAKGGWLQGFLVWTNFTVWTQDFQWNSNHPSSGLLRHDTKSGRCVTDDDGTLSKELQALPRGEQDPLDGGIVLKQVAEISLLGGLGCGELLFRKAIEDIRMSKMNGKCNYKYVVLQATEGSRRFYEKMGFVRVGAVCRYRWAEYCGKKNGSAGAITTGKKPKLYKVQTTDVNLKATPDPPPTFHGYRHWTYTNESSKSLDAHGGPSVMMCLKLEDIENDHNGYRQTVSELLKPHLVLEKPVIQLFGNVANPVSANVVPTRKSQRRSTGSGCLEGMQPQLQEQKHSSVNHRPSFAGVSGSRGLTAASATTRRTSTRSKRGQNASLANSGYVLYGVEGGRNCSNKSIVNETACSKNATKRQHRVAKLIRNVSRERKGTTKSPGKGCYPNKILTVCNKKDIETTSVAVAHLDHKLPSKSRNALSISDGSTMSSENMKSDYSLDITIMKSETKRVDFISTGAKTSVSAKVLNDADENSIEIRTLRQGQLDTIHQHRDLTRGILIAASPNTNKIHDREEQTEYSSLNNHTISPLLSKAGGKIEGSMIHETVEEVKRKKSASTSMIRQKGAKVPKQRAPVHHYGTRSNHPTTITARKRSRQPAMIVDASKLFKQRVNGKFGTNAEFCNQVVVRRNVQSDISQGYDHHISKRRRGNDNPKKGRTRWRYNGGIMINHRYEYCYYFVLHCNESERNLTIVPMIKDGVFERPTGNKSINSSTLGNRVLGRPRYQCNILKTDKNWIRNVPLEDYAIVPEAMAVLDTPLLAQEAWDICGNTFSPKVGHN